MRARKALWRKLTERSGDTLVEALTAILIAALGSALLATMVMSATNIASRNERALSAVYQAESNLATATPSGSTALSTGAIYIGLYQVNGPNGIEFARYAKSEKPK